MCCPAQSWPRVSKLRGRILEPRCLRPSCRQICRFTSQSRTAASCQSNENTPHNSSKSIITSTHTSCADVSSASSEIILLQDRPAGTSGLLTASSGLLCWRCLPSVSAIRLLDPAGPLWNSPRWEIRASAD